MDKFLRPSRLEVDPSSKSADKQWTHWFKTFSNFVSSMTDMDDGKRLNILINYVSPSIYTMIADCETYDAATGILAAAFIKPKNVIFARYALCTRRQDCSETIDQYVHALRALAKDCDFQAVSAAANQDEHIRDALISGLYDGTVRRRLLESDSLTLDSAIRTSRALELAKINAEHYSSPKFDIAAAAVSSSSDDVVKVEGAAIKCSAVQSQDNCFFCGYQRHSRSTCPARDQTCHKCSRKGHFARVCRSAKTAKNTASVVTSPASADQHLCTAYIASQATTALSKSIVSITVNGVPAKALIDTGSTDSFIHHDLVTKLRLRIASSTCRVTMATTRCSADVRGCCIAEVVLNGQIYKEVCFRILDDLCADAILGQDFMALHKEVRVVFGGDRPPLKVCAMTAAHVDAPSLFSGVPVDCKPIATPSRRFSENDMQFITSEVTRLENEGIIQPSTSPWRAQVVVAASDNGKKRLCIDYSQTINRVTPLDAYPLPKMDQLAKTVAKYKVFSSLDLRSAYHQVPIPDADRPFTAFEANGGLYQFCRIPFGVTNGVACFQRIMNKFISDNGLQDTYAYLDNIVVCGKDMAQHDSNLDKFLEAAKRYNFTFNESKSSYRQTTIDFLGYIITNGTLKPDPERLRPLREFPTPTDMASLRRAVGMLSYYSSWISRFSDKIRPLVCATDFPMCEAAINAFQELKKEVEAAVVSTIDENVPFVVETDASDYALAATLNQAGRPVAFFSKSLSSAERRHPAVEKEAAAIVEALRKWRHYLTGRHFTLITDQRSVAFMFDRNKLSKIKNDKIMRWRIELSCYHYDIVYRPGKANNAADAFSRVSASLFADTRNNRTASGSLLALHENLCHPGIRRLAHFVRGKNLPYSLDEIKRVTGSCQVCAELKPRFFRPDEAHLVKATRPFERVSMDFKGPLPTSTGNQYMLTLVDEYSRFPFVYPCTDMSTVTVISCLTRFFSVFGMPAFLHSDRGRQFMSTELKVFLTERGVATSRTTPYHPVSNGQCERYNGIIWKTVLLGLKTKGLPESRWESVLPDALHSIRSLLCTATNCTPHERLFNYERKSTSGCSLPVWLTHPGTVLLRRHVRNKHDPIVDLVELLEANEHYAHVRFPNGREDTVSIRDLAPSGSTVTPNDAPVNEMSTVTPDGAPAAKMDTLIPNSAEMPNTTRTDSMVKEDAADIEVNGSRSDGASADTDNMDGDVRKSTRHRQQPRRLIFERLGECSEL